MFEKIEVDSITPILQQHIVARQKHCIRIKSLRTLPMHSRCHGAISLVFGNKTRIWFEKDEIWPCRFRQRPDIALHEEVMVDARRLVSALIFITERQKVTGWGLAFHQSLRDISQEDFDLIESEIKKAVRTTPPISKKLSEREAKKGIDLLLLDSKSLHDRPREMLQVVGSWMGYNTFTHYRITPEHARELDVGWLRGKKPRGGG